MPQVFLGVCLQSDGRHRHVHHHAAGHHWGRTGGTGARPRLAGALAAGALGGAAGGGAAHTAPAIS